MQHGEKNKQPENLFSLGKADFFVEKADTARKNHEKIFTSKRLTTIKHP